MKNQNQLILARNYENKLLSEKFALAQILGTTHGFHQYYFDTLPYFETFTECFNNVNELYHSVFTKYKYSDYASFAIQRKRILKKTK
jgi:hypothetical protein